MISLVALSLAFAASAGPCDLLDRAAAAQLLGAPVTSMDPSGPEPDEDTGASRTTCTYMAGQAMLIVIRLDFPNAAAARDVTAASIEPEKLAEEKATVKQESGIGDKSYLIYNPRAAEYVVVKGATVLTLALGGTPNPLPSYEGQLRSAAAAATKKL